MPRGRRNNRGRGRGYGYVQMRSQVTRVKNSIKGHAVACPADPPKFSQIPWNQIVISDEPKLVVGVVKEYTPSDLYEMLKAQTGIKLMPDDSNHKYGRNISFRLQQVRVWNITGGDINLQAYDLTVGFGADDFLVQVEDQPGRNRWARIGYVWPASQQMVALSGHDTEKFVGFSSTIASNAVIHFHVLWKSRVSTFPNITAYRSDERYSSYK